MKMELPSPVLHSLFALNKAGYEAFIVGGCVRDSLMGKHPFDWDITTSALPEETVAVFKDFRTIETGIQHGTVTVIIEDMPLEITTYRVDGDYSDGRHPDHVSFTRSLTKDLQRRDFTINAMAYHPKLGLVDPFRGQKDLKKKIIRCVGKPKTRFTEDALRILRGLRFSSTLDFSVNPSTARSIHRLAHTLPCVSAERISVEFVKLLCGENVKLVFNEYADVLSVILPNIDFKKSAPLVSTATKDPVCRLASLMFDLPPNVAEELCNHLRLSSRITKDVTTLIRYRSLSLKPTRSHVLRALHKLGPELAKVLLSIRTMADQRDYHEFRELWLRLEEKGDLCYQVKDLAITGNDLIISGIPVGPEIGAILNSLLNAVMNGECPNQREELLKFATKKPVQ